MLDRSVSYFLSNYWRNTPLYAEKIIPLLDTCFSNNYVLSDKVAKAFYELTNKYKNTTDLPLESLKEFIREQGYGYILDLVSQDERSIKLLWYMLVLIHQLKGSKEGILLVLSLLDENFNPEKTNIVQWYETIPVGRPNTFTMETALNIAKLGDDFFDRFQTFLANYVYPEMLSMRVNYNVDGRITYRPYARVKIDCNATIDTKDCLSGGSSLDKFTRDIYDGGVANSERVGGYDPCHYLTSVVITEIIDEQTGQRIGFNVTGEEVECDPIDCGGAGI